MIARQVSNSTVVVTEALGKVVTIVTPHYMKRGNQSPPRPKRSTYVEPVIKTPVKRRNNRKDIQFSSNSYISKQAIDDSLELCKGNSKQFLKMIYANEGYKQAMTINGKLTKRGNMARNWRPEGVWLCTSLHYVNSVYQSIGQKKFSKTGVRGMQRPSRDQCVAITNHTNQRCKRGKCNGSIFCTQHETLLTLDKNIQHINQVL